MDVPLCICHHPLDAHDEKSGECKYPPRCSCTWFQNSGRTEKVRGA